MTNQTLLPCPHCGSTDISAGEVLTSSGVKGGLHAVTQSQCMECGATGPEAELGDGEVDYGSVKAIAAWNRRQSAAATPIAPVAWRFKDMAGNVHYADSVTPLAQSDITPLYVYAAPPSAVLLEVLEALKRSNEWLATYPGGGTLSPTGPYEQARAAIAKLREWMGEKG